MYGYTGKTKKWLGLSTTCEYNNQNKIGSSPVRKSSNKIPRIQLSIKKQHSSRQRSSRKLADLKRTRKKKKRTPPKKSHLFLMSKIPISLIPMSPHAQNCSCCTPPGIECSLEFRYTQKRRKEILNVMSWSHLFFSVMIMPMPYKPFTLINHTTVEWAVGLMQ